MGPAVKTMGPQQELTIVNVIIICYSTYKTIIMFGTQWWHQKWYSIYVVFINETTCNTQTVGPPVKTMGPQQELAIAYRNIIWYSTQ